MTSAVRAALGALLTVVLVFVSPAVAQETAPDSTPTQSGSMIRNATPLSLSLFVYPPYGIAPLTVGAFADVVDPLDAGVVSYYWNFGNGNVSTLPSPM
ncbi:MAG TPA: hypothetical protein VMB26_07800, partial [Candidatus Binataceae bacterium]|nr:hypothetical protein [Candidatus Binataceae bacterium]